MVTVAPANRRLGPDARRAQLVGVGLALMKEMPFDEVTAEIVARAGGVSKGLVFHYFPTTRDLQVAILRAAAAELLADLDVGAGLPPDERLRVGLDAFVRYIEQQPASYQAVVRRAGSDERLLAVFEDTRSAVVGIGAGRCRSTVVGLALGVGGMMWRASGASVSSSTGAASAPGAAPAAAPVGAGAASTVLSPASGAGLAAVETNHDDTHGSEENR